MTTTASVSIRTSPGLVTQDLPLQDQTPAVWNPNCVVRRHNSGVERIANWSSCCKIVRKLEITPTSSRLGDILKVALFALANVALTIADVIKGAFTVIKGAVTKVFCCNRAVVVTPVLTAEELAIQQAEQERLQEAGPGSLNGEEGALPVAQQSHGEAIMINGLQAVVNGHVEAARAVNVRIDELAARVNNIEGIANQTVTNVHALHTNIGALGTQVTAIENQHPGRVIAALDARLHRAEERLNNQVLPVLQQPQVAAFAPSSSSSSSMSSSSFRQERLLPSNGERIDELEIVIGQLQAQLQQQQQPQTVTAQVTVQPQGQALNVNEQAQAQVAVATAGRPATFVAMNDGRPVSFTAVNDGRPAPFVRDASLL